MSVKETLAVIDGLVAKEVEDNIIVLVMSSIFSDRHAPENLGISIVAMSRSILHNKAIADKDKISIVRRALAEKEVA